MGGLLDAIAAAQDVAVRDVAVVEWGCTVRLRRFGPVTALRIAAEVEGIASDPERFWRQAYLFLQAAVLDPATGVRVFDGDRGMSVLQDRDPVVVLRLYRDVLSLFPSVAEGVAAEEAGKEWSASNARPSSRSDSPVGCT